MKVGFVVEPYEESHASGMGYATLETMRHLPLAIPEHEFVFFSSKPISLEFLPRGSRNELMPRGFLKQFFWFRNLRKHTVDVLLFVAPLLPLWINPGIKTIVLCKDLASYVMGAASIGEQVKIFIRDRVLMPTTLKRATWVATPSQATKDDLVRLYTLSPQKVRVTYEGVQDFSDCPEESINLSLVPYFFFASKVKPRKNVHGIARAFVMFKQKTKAPCRLVLSGDAGGPYLEEVKKILRDGGVEKDVHFVGYVTKGQLRAWFTHAVAFVYASLSEGFGMPIIEAMSLGAPVITANISSMAEVAGEAALLVDPHKPKQIAEAFERLYTDEALRVQLRTKGLARAKLFSWSSVAAEYATLIRAL